MSEQPQRDTTASTAGLDPEVDSTLDRHTDLEELRNGGPTRTPGVMTTTGGTAGPASVGRRFLPGAGPTTTGDAGSGGLSTPVGGATSDASTAGTGAAAVTDADGAPGRE